MESPNFRKLFATTDYKIKSEIQEKKQEEQGEMMPAQEQMMADPFNYSQFKNARLPDNPIAYGNSMADSLLNDNEVPEKIKDEFWWVFHKDNTLTFIDTDRKVSKMLSFDIAMIDLLNTMPYYDYDFKIELEKTVLRNVFETKLDRAMGFEKNTTKNERIILQSQFSEQRNINENNESQTRGGFFRKLFGRK